MAIMSSRFAMAMSVVMIGAAYGVKINLNTGTGTRCNNYIRLETNSLYPVGVCYSENNDPFAVCGPNETCNSVQNMMYKCEETANGTEACLYRMGDGCSNVIFNTGECYPCNGEVDDQCECSVGNQGATNCQYYEETTYEETTSPGGSYCYALTSTLQRRVVNMCIQGSSTSATDGGASNVGYSCGGYDDRSGANQDYAFGYEVFSDTGCSSIVPSPTATPTAPTQAVPYCKESTCNGVSSPGADTTVPNSLQTTEESEASTGSSTTGSSTTGGQTTKDDPTDTSGCYEMNILLTTLIGTVLFHF